MFIGHYAVALGAKRASPRTSLGALTLATSFLDLLWPTLLALGVERVALRPGITAFTPLDFEYYPWSHSLLMAVAWGVLVGFVYLGVTRDRRGAWVMGAVVVSHWVLDWLTHRPDLPLYPGSERVGLGMWNHPVATLVVEVGIYAAGVALYLRATRARDRVGRWAFGAYAAFLAVVYTLNVTSPPPPNVRALMIVGQALWLLPLWAWWVDRHREARGAT